MTSRLRHPVLSASVLATLVWLAGCGPEATPPPVPDQRPASGRVTVNERAIGIPYGEWILLRTGTRQVLVRLDPEDGTGFAVAYRYRVSPETVSEFAGPHVEAGSGRTEETFGMGRVTAGRLQMDWSRGSDRTGWLYWPPEHTPVEVWPFTFDDPGAVPRALANESWLGRPKSR